MARSLDSNGAAKVFIIGRRLDKLEEVAASSKGKSIVPVEGDVASKESLRSCVQKIGEHTQFVNCVIANSGITGPTFDGLPKDRTASLTELYNHLWETPMEEFNNTFLINSTALFYTMVAFMPLLDAGNNHPASPTTNTTIKSQFIATGSIGGLSRRPGMGFAYAGSKAAAIHLIKAMSTWMVPYHIRCNIINPGIYPSDMSAVSKSTWNKAVPFLTWPGIHGR